MSINPKSALISMIPILSLILISYSVTEVRADSAKHPVQNCTFCGCFFKYENRDTALPLLPYKEVAWPTEDECLAFCWREVPLCKAVTYGIVGGSVGIICELYMESGLSNNLQYQWAMNYYEPVLNWPCGIPVPTVRPGVRITNADQTRAKLRKEVAARNAAILYGR